MCSIRRRALLGYSTAIVVTLCGAIILKSGYGTETSSTSGRTSDPILERIDFIYSEMPPLQWEPPIDRWRYLERTIEVLKTGGTLRVVMLGDSIVNDTSRSAWEKLVERLYPGAHIEKITSVRGSTGCWYYKDPVQLQEYVLKHKPDLVMIGGISHRNDIESVREVIRGIRAGLEPDPEILLLSSCFGHKDPRFDPEWTFEVPNRPEDFRFQLKRLAEEEKTAFLDMTGPWGQYIRTCGEDIHWFKRDIVHANARGEAILARILERFFAP
ncbi:MAG: SGNH/GDSL hydrolase family protein [Thermogutta sp.]